MTVHPLHLRWASLVDFDGRFVDLLQRLPPDEQERAARFQIISARRRFILARTVVRQALGTILGLDPAGLVFAAGEHGKPQLADPEIADPPHFNLSHSGDLVTLAIAGSDVGVDIENLRQIRNAEKMAHRFFSPAERMSVFELDGEARDRAFLRIWTQKEAYLKATGLGVGMPLRGVETEPDPEAAPRLQAISGDADEAGRWTLLEAEIPDAVCTVAIRGPAAPLRVDRFTPADLDAR